MISVFQISPSSDLPTLPLGLPQSERLTPHAFKIAFSSSALVAFLKRAPDFPFTRCSQSAQVA